MEPAVRITLWAVGYSAFLAFAMAIAPREHSDGLVFGAGLLVTIYAALADLRLALRLPIALLLALFFAALLTLSFGVDPNALLSFAAVYALIVGLLAPLRIYAGTIGQPRASQPRQPSLLALFGLTLYFAFVALLLTSGDDPVSGLMGAGFMGAACASPVLALLSESRKARILGVVLAMGVLLASAGSLILSGPAFWLAAFMLAEVLLTPLAGVIVLRLNGYRLRR